MDYQRCQHRFTILYPLPEGIRGYFSDRVTSTVAVGIDQASIRCTVESPLDPLAAKGVLCLLVRVPHRQRVQVKKARLTGVGLFRDLHRDACQLGLVGE